MRKPFPRVCVALVGLGLGALTVSARPNVNSPWNLSGISQVAMPAPLGDGSTSVHPLLARNGEAWELRAIRSHPRGSALYNSQSGGEAQILPAPSLANKSIIAATTDVHGRIYVADSSSIVRLLGRNGHEAFRFRVAPVPESVAVNPAGELFVARPSRGKLIHAYSPQGRWLRSFGDVKPYAPESPAFNDALNTGHVFAASGGEIVYVPLDAPEPSFMVFSAAGELLREHAIHGAAVDAQLPSAKSTVEAATNAVRPCIGTINIIRAAAVDQATGDVWVSFNPTTAGGNLHQYRITGEKLGEYDVYPSGGDRMTPIVGLAVADGVVYASSPDGAIHTFSVPQSRREVVGAKVSELRALAAAFFSPSMPVVEAQPPPSTCPPQNIGSCTRNCNNGQNINCAAELYGSLTQDPSFPRFDPQCNAHNDQGKCIFNAKTCNPTTLAIHQHSTDPGCPCNSQPGGCSGFNWVRTQSQCSQPQETDYCGCCFADASPIFLDLGREGFAFSNAEEGVIFAIGQGGSPRRFAWPLDSARAPWLALDRNGNGEVDDLGELFGNMTFLASGERAAHGYEALAEHDENKDGWIDERDPIFGKLLLWSDINRNGVSEPEELRPLAERKEVGAIATAATESRFRDEWGNEFRYWAPFVAGKRTEMSAANRSWDVFFVSESVPPYAN